MEAAERRRAGRPRLSRSSALFLNSSLLTRPLPSPSSAFTSFCSVRSGSLATAGSTGAVAAFDSATLSVAGAAAAVTLGGGSAIGMVERNPVDDRLVTIIAFLVLYCALA